jgi:hypothetical protein
MEIQVTKRIQWAWCVSPGDDAALCGYFVPLADVTPVAHKVLTTEWGYGVRESAPGYLDCTEWEVLGTLKEARALATAIEAQREEDEA